MAAAISAACVLKAKRPASKKRTTGPGDVSLHSVTRKPDHRDRERGGCDMHSHERLAGSRRPVHNVSLACPPRAQPRTQFGEGPSVVRDGGPFVGLSDAGADTPGRRGASSRLPHDRSASS
jgi:hypothetical protein